MLCSDSDVSCDNVASDYVRNRTCTNPTPFFGDECPVDVTGSSMEVVNGMWMVTLFLLCLE